MFTDMFPFVLLFDISMAFKCEISLNRQCGGGGGWDWVFKMSLSQDFSHPVLSLEGMRTRDALIVYMIFIASEITVDRIYCERWQTKPKLT